MLNVGGRIAYWRGDIKGLVEDISASKPTMFAGVPRVFERIYGGVQAKMKVAGWLKNALFNFAFDRKKHFMEQGHSHDIVRPSAPYLLSDYVLVEMPSLLGREVVSRPIWVHVMRGF